MTEQTLSKAQEQILREQVIDAGRPGPVLRDFQTVLDFVGTEGVRAGGKYNLLPIEAIGELDARLSHPLRLQLKRPQLRSHPFLQGLHLLLRASGLTRVEGKGPKARLVVDPVMLEQWRRLNPTERYFNLLEAWLLVGRPEMVGERGYGFDGGLLTSWLWTWDITRSLEGPSHRDRRWGDYLFAVVGDLYQFALRDLFGLVAFETSNAPGEAWCPGHVQIVPFGDAVFTLLGQWFGSQQGAEMLEEENEEEPVPGVRFGRLQPLFQPYFPEWRENLAVPQPEAREGMFVFRVSLGKAWRLIAVPADSTLDALVSWVLRSVDFDSDHLYEITYRDPFGAEASAMHPYCDEGPWADRIPLRDLPIQPGQSMKLTYDFGDDWRFDIRLERIEPPGRIKKPRILESHGKAPEQYPNWE
jgi:hypothetical protein